MLITTYEYAARRGVTPAAIRAKIRRGKLDARKMGRDWVIEEDAPYIDHRRRDKKEKEGD